MKHNFSIDSSVYTCPPLAEFLFLVSPPRRRTRPDEPAYPAYRQAGHTYIKTSSFAKALPAEDKSGGQDDG